MFDTYNVPSKIDVEHFGNVLLRDQKHEWRESHCKNCKNGIIAERYFDEKVAIEYMVHLQEIGFEKASCSPCVSMQTHLHSMPFYAAQRGDKIDFYKEKSYKCVHHYCNKINNI